MRHSSAYPDKGRSFETTTNLFDLYCLWRSAEGEDPSASDLLGFFGRIPVEILYLMNTGGDNPAD
ncbi:MAG: hypothetical protein ABI988_18440 [Nitrospirota bacterium]